MKFKDQVVIVTGASAGVGEECARQFAKQGAKVVLAARSKDAIESLVKELGNGAIAVPTDVAKRKECERLIEQSVA